MGTVLVAAVFGEGDACGLCVDDGLVPGECGGEGVDREVVDGSWVAAGGVVDDGDGVGAEQGVCSAGDLEVVVEVAGGVLGGHPGQRVADGDPLVQRGEDTEPESVPEGGLADQQRGER